MSKRVPIYLTVMIGLPLALSSLVQAQNSQPSSRESATIIGTVTDEWWYGT
jgi:hypothetical protein